MSPRNEQSKDDLSRVLEISRAMAAQHDLKGLLGLIIEHSLELLNVERATLFIYDPDKHQLVADIVTGMDQLRVPADKGFCGEVVKTGKPLLIPDAYADARFNPEVDKQSGFRTRNILSIPLKNYENKLVGVLQLLNKKDGDFSEENITLAETLGAQAGVSIDRANLIEHYLKKQQLERAMQIARDIQQRLLPDKPPSVDGYDIAGFSQPADETGGDTFDFIPLPNGEWAIMVADATGHGIGAALVIAETRAMLRATAHLSRPDEIRINQIFETANFLLLEDLGGTSFVTCFLGILNPESRKLTWASAGHGPILIYHYEDQRFEEFAGTTLPLGILDDVTFDSPQTVTLMPGDQLIVTTDGVFEALGDANEQFGIERVIRHFRENHDLSAEQQIQKLWQDVKTFAPGPQDDDITAVVMKRCH